MVIAPETPLDTLPKLRGIETEIRSDGSLALTYRGQDTRAETVLTAVQSAGIAIRELRTEQPDLEDVFLSLTRSTAD